jgi:hypothetical protein
MAEGAGVLSCYCERPSSEQRDRQDSGFTLVMALVFVPGDAESGTRGSLHVHEELSAAVSTSEVNGKRERVLLARLRRYIWGSDDLQ